MGNIKVFLSDAQVIFREGIHFTLSGDEDFEITGETASNEEALKSVKDNPPDIAFVSLNNGKPDGYETTKYIRRNLPLTSVILVVEEENEDQLLAAIKCGARAIIHKNIAPEDLIATVREVAHGHQPIVEALFTPGIASKVSDEFKETSAINEQFGNTLANLSDTDITILNDIAEGSDIAQVADRLGSDEGDIRNQLGLIISKLVMNEQRKAVLDVVMRNFISTAASLPEPQNEYLTRKEFEKFKEDLAKRCKALINELVQRKKSSPVQKQAVA